MSDWSVSAVGVNPKATAFQGAALNMARILNLPREVTDFFMEQQKELLSNKPTIPEGISQQFAVAFSSAGDKFSPAGPGGQNSGRGTSLA